MKKEQTIISWAEEIAGEFDPESLTIHESGSRAEAKDFIVNTLTAEAKELGTYVHPLSGDVMDMWKQKEGSFSYRIGSHIYHIRFLNVPGEYGVSDDEAVATIEAFCNCCRSGEDYKRVAERISAEMHRHCQNELWKFVKQLIRAFAMGRYDERNETASNEAGAVHGYIVTMMKK